MYEKGKGFDLKVQNNIIIQRMINKKMKEIGGKFYWGHDNGEIRIVPEMDERVNLIKEIHEKSIHRGVEATHHKIK